MVTTINRSEFTVQGALKIYIDTTEEITTINKETGNITGDISNSEHFYIGSLFSVPNDIFDGTIDGVRIYSKSLPQPKYPKSTKVENGDRMRINSYSS